MSIVTQVESADDARTVQQFLAGDHEAFHDLLAQHANRLRWFLVSRGARGDILAEVEQDVWLRVWEKRQSFDGQNFRAWLFRIARNFLVDSFRRDQIRQKHQGELEIQARSHREWPTLNQRKEDIEALRNCIEKTGGDFVDVLRAEINGDTVEDIAGRLGITPATVYSRKSRGRQLLKDCIEQQLE